jgi:hypothetical protein
MLNSFFALNAFENSSIMLNRKIVEPRLDFINTGMKSVSENILDFLGLKCYSLFIDPIYYFLDFDNGLPFVH